MRQANFRKKGRAVLCGECGHIWNYRGKQKSKNEFVTCPKCRTSNRLGDSILPQRIEPFTVTGSIPVRLKPQTLGPFEIEVRPKAK